MFSPASEVPFPLDNGTIKGCRPDLSDGPTTDWPWASNTWRNTRVFSASGEPQLMTSHLVLGISKIRPVGSESLTLRSVPSLCGLDETATSSIYRACSAWHGT